MCVMDFIPIENLNYDVMSSSTNDYVEKLSSINFTTNDEQYFNTIVLKKELGKLLFISIEIHDCEFKVCFRQFKRDENNSIIPEEHEIIMDLFTWYDFYKKLPQFNLIYATSSFVANNNILVLNSNSQMHIRDLNVCTLQNMKLSEYQFELLKKIIPELNTSLINFLFTDYLSYLIRKEQRFVLKSCKSDDLMMINLIISIEHELKKVFKKIFQCHGCKIFHINPLNHECITFNNLEKYHLLGHDILMLINISDVISDFLNDIDFVTREFLHNINVEVIKNVLFK